MNTATDRDSRFWVAVIAAVGVLSLWKLWLIRDVIWDDNCWLLSAYATSSLTEFLDTGWNQFRRPILGTLMYYLYGLHKTSDAFYLVWHSLTLISEISSPILLFYLVRALFPGQQALAFFTAIAFILFHLDHSLPYVSAIHYRIGQAFALGSLLLTVRSVTPGAGIRWLPYAAALALALISHSILIEPAIALEPGRALIIGWLLYASGSRGAPWIRRALAYTLPFLFAILPLALHKILYRPYGIYAGTYPTNPFFFLEWNKNLTELWRLLVRDWFTLLRDARHTDLPGIIAWVLTLGILLFAAQKLQRMQQATVGDTSKPDGGGTNATTLRLRHALMLGLVLLLPSVWLFEYAGLDTILFGSQDNVHAVFMQPGYALLIGAGMTWVFRKFSGNRNSWRALFLLLPLSLGALINNASLDFFRDSWRQQSLFWHAFVQRFPTLPERADFLFDIRGQGGITDLRNHFDHEAWLNLLYSRATRPADFKRYRVMTLEDFAGYARKNPAWPAGEQKYERVTQLGPEAIEPRRLIPVLYAGGRIFVGREILERFGNQVPYWPWLQNFQQSGTGQATEQDFPWRGRIEGF